MLIGFLHQDAGVVEQDTVAKVAAVFCHGQPLHVAQPDVLCLKGISGLSNLHISHVHRGVETVCYFEMLCPLTRLHGVTTQKTII